MAVMCIASLRTRSPNREAFPLNPLIHPSQRAQHRVLPQLAASAPWPVGAACGLWRSEKVGAGNLPALPFALLCTPRAILAACQEAG